MIRIKMLTDVVPDLFFLATPGTLLRVGTEYEATANVHGAVSGICPNGKQLGVRPGEFEFTEAPDWLRHIWKREYPDALKQLQQPTATPQMRPGH